MKKLRKTLMTILMVVSMVFIIATLMLKVAIAAGEPERKEDATLGDITVEGLEDETYKYFFTYDRLNDYDNLTCVRLGGYLPAYESEMSQKEKQEWLHKLTTYVEINGNNAKFYAGESHSTEDVGTLLWESNCEENNIMAALLCEGYGSEDGGDGDLWQGADKMEVYRRQNTIWYFWDMWLDASVLGRSADLDKDFVYESELVGTKEQDDYWIQSIKAPNGKYVDLTHSRYYNQANLDSVGKEEGVNVIDIISKEFLVHYAKLASERDYSATIYHFVDKAGDDVALQHVILSEKHESTTKKMVVTKEWIDGGNTEKRKEITVQLYKGENGAEIPIDGKQLKLNEENNWTGVFENLPLRDDNDNIIYYIIKELNCPEGYNYKGISGDTGSNSGTYVLTNVLNTEVTVKKEWNDRDNIDEQRPESITVMLSQKVGEGSWESTGNSVTLNEGNDWTYTWKELDKYNANNEKIEYKVEEVTVTDYETTYNTTVNEENGYTTVEITNTLPEPNYDGYIEITGKAWEDGEAGKSNDTNGVLEQDEKGISNVTVRLKYVDENGKHRLFNENIPSVYETKTDNDGNYKIVVNYDNSKNVYKLYEDIGTVNKKLETAYVEFEYDGMTYTTVASADKGADTSKAIENEKLRNNFDNAHSTVISTTLNPKDWTDRNITAETKNVISYERAADENREVVVKYCNGNGTYDRTDPEGAWKIIENQPNKYPCENCNGIGHDIAKYSINVQKIPNINLGLFKREQPEMVLFTDISKVEVEMNNERYTYLYGVRSNKYKPEDANYIQAKFQNKDTEPYTYKRPVNPADIGYLKTVNENAMEVYVTYAITIGNLSNTLTISVDSIANYYDSNYLIKYGDGDDATERYHITYGTMDPQGTITGIPLNANQISEPVVKDGYSEITLSGLGIKVTAQGESENKIYIRYRINQDKLSSLFDNEPPLNNATEIFSYSTTYGKGTIYAEQGVGERENRLYGGYDNDSHPGNVIPDGRLELEEERLKIKEQEPDEDIAPAFVLCKDSAPKVLSGTVWEDTKSGDIQQEEKERLGNGHIDSSEEKAKNVTIELYERSEDGTITKAQLYDNDGKKKEIDESSKVYSDENGSYSLSGVVTGKDYFVVFTYGNNTDDPNKEPTTNEDAGKTTINGEKVNARNYKSTIITDEKIKDILGKDYTDDDFDKKWIINHTDNYSVAVDNMKQRMEIESLKNSNFENKVEISAYTKPFVVPLEIDYTGNNAGNSDADGKVTDKNATEITNVLDRLDFGIIERPREDLVVQKTITDFSIKLSNGQVLAEGNPNDKNATIPYTKTMGFAEIKSIKDARLALEKQMLVEMDTELIQGAQLDIKYAVNIINNNEIDYDYEDYNTSYAEIADTVKNDKIDGYITKQEEADYYYFGDNSNNPNGQEKLAAKIQFVDYMSRELSLKNDNNDGWDKNVKASELKENGFISQGALDAIGEYGYQVLQKVVDENNSRIITIGHEDEFKYTSSELIAYKTLANKDENVYDNNAEIIEIDGKTARTVKGKDENGNQLIYVPGNYEPGEEAEYEEPDDDRVKIIITPPTGITNNIVIYAITIFTGLIIVLIGVIFIKKKVLIK